MCINTFPWMQSTDIKGELIDNPYLAMVEAGCISYFTLEFFIRLAGAPHKLGFLKGTMNIVDVLAIAPYYLTLFLLPAPNIDIESAVSDEAGDVERAEEESGLGNAGRIMQVLNIIKYSEIFFNHCCRCSE